MLATFLNNTLPVTPRDVDWNQVYELSKIHSLSGAVYTAVRKLPVAQRPPRETFNRFASAFYATVLRAEKQSALIENILEKLNEKKIPHLLIKGAVLRAFYPVPEMRTLGDIDLMIHEEDWFRTDATLRGAGYVLKGKSDGEWKYFKNGMEIEVHSKIRNEYIGYRVGCNDCFNNMWEYAAPLNGSFTYRWEKNFQLIYLISHTAKHLYGRGCGLRMLADIAVVLRHDGDRLRFDDVFQELEKIHLDVFARSLFALCKRCFGVPDAVPCADMPDARCDEAMEYLLVGGTFGFNREITVNLVRSECENTDCVTKACFNALWHKIFPSWKDMRILYPRLARYACLMPLAWMARGIRCLLFKREKTFTILEGLVHPSDEAKKAYVLLEKLGLE